MNQRTRLKPEDRKAAILEAAIAEAQEVGYMAFTRDGVRLRAGVSAGLLNARHGTMAQLRRAVMRAAVERRLVDLVAQGIGARDPQALKAPEDLRQQALDRLTTA